MDTRRSVLALLGLFFASSRHAFAQGELDAQIRDQNERDRLYREQEERAARRQRGPGYRPGEPSYEQPGTGPEHRWHRGDRLPYEYRHRNYVVDDWRAHRLHRPPPGYQWVQSGNDYLLVAIATGVIAELLLNR